MANAEMYDYLPTITPANVDYTAETLAVKPTEILISEGKKAQKVLTMGDGSFVVVSKSNQSYFIVTLKWDAISREDHGTILDFYHSTNKANGMERTFYWEHPHADDGHTYVARFIEPLTDEFVAKQASLRNIQSIKLFILGRKAD